MEYISSLVLDADVFWHKGLCVLHEEIFAVRSMEAALAELVRRPRFLILLAVDDGRVVGYKIGYEERRDRFYSWIGGVHPEYREKGVASELMRRQHDWCLARGYRSVRTLTKNKWRSMLILNLRHGFDVIGAYTDARGEPKIILEKRFDAGAGTK